MLGLAIIHGDLAAWEDRHTLQEIIIALLQNGASVVTIIKIEAQSKDAEKPILVHVFQGSDHLSEEVLPRCLWLVASIPISRKSF